MKQAIPHERFGYSGVRKLFGWLDTATFEVKLDKGRVAYMQAELPHHEDYFVVVLVDADRFVQLWRQPDSSHREIALQNAETWPQDHKYSEAVDGFSHGFENPVPLAQVSCWTSSSDRVQYERRFIFFKRKVMISRAGDHSLRFIDGITRTIYLLANGAKSFPVLCERQTAHSLVELAGWSDTPPLALSLLRASALATALPVPN